MRIAFARYNQNTDLDYALASVASRNTEERLGILEAMVELGHDVTIVSWVSKKHRHVFKGESKGRFDNGWMTSLVWDMNADMQSFDLFFVETASANTMFSFGWDGERVGYVEHFAELLYETVGVPVLVYHHGPAELAFPFDRMRCMLMNPLTDEELAKLSPHNYRNIFHGMDIWGDYEYTVWHKAYTTGHFLRDGAMKHSYARPELADKLKFVATDIGYSPRYDTVMPARDPASAEFDLVYVGRANKRERIAKIHKYYDNPNYTSLLVGKGWDEELWEHYVTAPGQSKYHGDVQEHYGRGLACVQTLDKDLAVSGMATTRHIQSIHSGCITMVDSDISGGDRWVGGEDFVVSSPADVVDVLEFYCDTHEHLREANDYQRSCLKRWVDVVPHALAVAVGKEGADKV